MGASNATAKGPAYDEEDAKKGMQRKGKQVSVEEWNKKLLEKTYTTTLAYIAIPYSLREKIADEDGYAVTERSHVPSSVFANKLKCVRTYRKHHPKETDILILRVKTLPDNIFKKEGQTSKLFAGLKYLSKKHLADGVFETRPQDYSKIPCPFCDECVPSLSKERTEIGISRYCGAKDNPALNACMALNHCIDKQLERSKRIFERPPEKLYHMTDRRVAGLLKDGGFKRGGRGVAGGAIYFAFTPRETEWKAECCHDKRVVLECLVWRGQVKEVDQASGHSSGKDRKIKFSSLVKENYDSVLVKRGKVPKGRFKGKPSGDEEVVYSHDQVVILGEVRRDPVPP